MDQLLIIAQFILDNFLHIWPYLLITIPVAVAVNLSGASQYIRRAFRASPIVAVLLATLVGAFSPFCSCSVIPLVASLLIGGVPLAPVMAFWIASPSMDPEIFFLSVGILGWELALWRLAGTLLLSLSAGYLTHWLTRRGWLGEEILRKQGGARDRGDRRLPTPAAFLFTGNDGALTSATPAIALATAPSVVASPSKSTTGCCRSSCGDAQCAIAPPSLRRQLWQETWSATRMVLQFMALAFLLEALILHFVPEAWIIALLGAGNRWAVPVAALLGVPVYTSNLTALPLVGGLLQQGMNPGAALAFLVAGPTTTLPAMAAVWGLVKRRIFILYVLLTLAGAVSLGYFYSLLSFLKQY